MVIDLGKWNTVKPRELENRAKKFAEIKNHHEDVEAKGFPGYGTAPIVKGVTKLLDSWLRFVPMVKDPERQERKALARSAVQEVELLRFQPEISKNQSEELLNSISKEVIDKINSRYGLKIKASGLDQKELSHRLEQKPLAQQFFDLQNFVLNIPDEEYYTKDELIHSFNDLAKVMSDEDIHKTSYYPISFGRYYGDAKYHDSFFKGIKDLIELSLNAESPDEKKILAKILKKTFFYNDNDLNSKILDQFIEEKDEKIIDAFRYYFANKSTFLNDETIFRIIENCDKNEGLSAVAKDIFFSTVEAVHSARSIGVEALLLDKLVNKIPDSEFVDFVNTPIDTLLYEPSVYPVREDLTLEKFVEGRTFNKRSNFSEIDQIIKARKEALLAKR